MSSQPPEELHETRLERRLDRAVARATTPRGAAIVITFASTVTAVAAGLLMTVLDREHYPSIGSGLWWAIQTTTTVGYGDNVPVTSPDGSSRLLVMLFGIGFLTVITAAITSAFVARSRVEQERSDGEISTAEQFRRLDERLERIEAALTRGSTARANEAALTARSARQLRDRSSSESTGRHRRWRQ